MNFDTMRRGFVGFLLCLIVGVSAVYIGKSTNLPVMLLAVVLGLMLHRLEKFKPLRLGINWSAKGLLYIGVALMGLRIDFADLSQAGYIAPIIVLITMGLTLLFGLFIGRALGQTRDCSILMSGAVSICGVSAVAAISASLEDCETRSQELAVTVAGITALSTIVMVLYPIIARLFNMNDIASALLMGGGIHNVSQAVGAGYAMSPEAGDLSVLLKLLRVSMLLPIILAVSLMWGKNAAIPYPSVWAKVQDNTPRFLVIFVVLAVLNCAGLIPQSVNEVGNQLAYWALVVSLVAIGIKTNMRDVIKVGVKPLIVMILTTVFMGSALIILGAICGIL